MKQILLSILIAVCTGQALAQTGPSDQTHFGVRLAADYPYMLGVYTSYDVDTNVDGFGVRAIAGVSTALLVSLAAAEADVYYRFASQNGNYGYIGAGFGGVLIAFQGGSVSGSSASLFVNALIGYHAQINSNLAFFVDARPTFVFDNRMAFLPLFGIGIEFSF